MHLNVEQLLKSTPGITLQQSADYYPDRRHQPGLPLLVIDNKACRAVIALQGAQLLEFEPKGGSALLWLSPNALFSPGKAIRGGIPLCLPWFGVNQQSPDKPKHGFARNRDWQLSSANTDCHDTTHIAFELDYAGDNKTLFACPFSARLEISLGQTLQLVLTVTNTGQTEIPLTWAMHSYHPVTSLPETRVTGLSGYRYLDNTRNLAAAIQMGDIDFNGEVDRAYEKVGDTQIIEGSPRIRIDGHGCDSAIVWNPGAENAAAIDDIGSGNHCHFVCVERGAAFKDALRLAAGEQIKGRLEVSQVH